MSVKRNLYEGLSQKNREYLERLLLGQKLRYPYITEILSSVPADPETRLTDEQMLAFGIENYFDWHSMMPFQKKVICFMGAPGVGKSTTIAKLAARIRMAFDLQVGVLSIGAEPISKRDRLEFFSKRYEIPFQKLARNSVHTATLNKSLRHFQECDLVLVDVCSDQALLSVSELSESEKILVLPAYGTEAELWALAQPYSELDIERVVVTHVDRTGYLGPVLNTVAALRKPLAFFTTGKRVPADIEPASARFLARCIAQPFH